MPEMMTFPTTMRETPSLSSSSSFVSRRRPCVTPAFRQPRRLRDHCLHDRSSISIRLVVSCRNVYVTGGLFALRVTLTRACVFVGLGLAFHLGFSSNPSFLVIGHPVPRVGVALAFRRILTVGFHGRHRDRSKREPNSLLFSTHCSSISVSEYKA